mmetsp:Transcript_3223/g.7869  ORF Transcript_3223/g.7869 Transcript_3223/m.7869 type:complete len:297 (-) Transcript_3223:521-1411(-)
MAAAVAADAAEAFRVVHPRKFLSKFLEEEVRPDGRDLLGFRRCTVSLGEIGTADGSAIARLGDTTVVAGIKAELANPPVDTPGSGWLVPNVTLTRMCSPTVRPGPPGVEAQALSACLNETLDGCIDLTQLCLARGKLAWVIHLTVTVLNEDGNLTDACMLAAVAALRDLRLPRLTPIGPEDNALPTVVAEKAVAVELTGPPVAVSFARCNGQMLADATSFEETLAVQTVTFVHRGATGILSGVMQPSPNTGPAVGSVQIPSAAAGIDGETMRQLYAHAARRATEIAFMIDAAAASR